MIQKMIRYGISNASVQQFWLNTRNLDDQKIQINIRFKRSINCFNLWLDQMISLVISYITIFIVQCSAKNCQIFSQGNFDMSFHHRLAFNFWNWKLKSLYFQSTRSEIPFQYNYQCVIGRQVLLGLMPKQISLKILPYIFIIIIIIIIIKFSSIIYAIFLKQLTEIQYHPPIYIQTKFKANIKYVNPTSKNLQCNTTNTQLTM